MKTYKFYDTSALLALEEDIFNGDDEIIISSITLQELENIKTSAHKDEEIKAAARKVVRLLDRPPRPYQVYLFKNDMLDCIYEKCLEITPDTKILATAVYYDLEQHPDETVFVTNDKCLALFANLYFGEDSVIAAAPVEKDDYRGYVEVCLNDEEIAEFYSNLNENMFHLNTNEYIIIYNEDKDIIDKLKWDGEKHETISFYTFGSRHFGDVKPKRYDPYQALAMDALATNKITMLKGPAGSGKSFLSLAYLFHKLDKGAIDKIIVFCNPVAARNAARLGFYPGTRDEKLLDSQIGNFLSAKFGDQSEVQHLIQQGRLVLLPMADIRGYDTSGMRAGIYITEAQNLDVSLIKLALQRIGEDCICVLDGDEKTQVDLREYAGANNGMTRVSQVFRGQDIYGEVTLQQIHRSKIAEIADKL